MTIENMELNTYIYIPWTSKFNVRPSQFEQIGV